MRLQAFLVSLVMSLRLAIVSPAVSTMARGLGGALQIQLPIIQWKGFSPVKV